MSIVDALEKAKRMAQQRSAAVQSPVQRSAEPARPGPRAVAQEVQPVMPQVVVAREKITFQELTYDISVCAENRIVVPEVEPLLTQAAPAYRMLRAGILQRCRANSWSSLAITSPGPNEGKSVTALNLAISIAREGNYDVFLIDLDMRNPSTCKYLGVSPPTDISEFFAGKATEREVLFTLGLDRLTVAGSNTAVRNASELLASDHLEQLLEFIKGISPNPLILLDLPPIVNTDDALVVAPRIDASVLVVSESYTRRDGLQRALELLAEFALAGVVLNQSSESIGSEYHDAYY